MNIAVVFAGGVGKRMHSHSLPKQFLVLHGKPIIIRTLEHFEQHEAIDAIVIACVKEWIDYLDNLINEYKIKKVKKIVPGGSTGQQSIYNGLLAAKEVSELEGDTNSIVLIHDGVRPMITKELISLNIDGVKQHGTAITSAPLKETLLLVDENEYVADIPSRSICRIAKAPQSFYLNEIIEVHHQAQRDGIEDFVDSCSMMKYYGKQVRLIDGPVQNIKVTTISDFFSVRAMLDSLENGQIYGLDAKHEGNNE